jgi:glycosyltransferase involved in cell wall biosynthesis
LDRRLHIVCHDVPYPPDYGGVFDLYYKLKNLYQLGIKIHLHCFEYGRGKQPVLNEFCESVSYYERLTGHQGLSFKIPFIVSSRANAHLEKNLNQNDWPVLLEGIHCTYLLNTGQLKNRKAIVRLHNIEHEYYNGLCRATQSPIRKLYYWNESRLLKKYEREVALKADLIIAVSEKDKNIYQESFHSNNLVYLPVFVAWDRVSSKEGVGNFCLYHGNLSVPENEKAAVWLVQNVFKNITIPFVIAGKNPSSRLKRLVHSHNHVCLVANPSEKEMQDLIQKAQINVLPSFNNTGIKLKLLNAVFCGRHCVVNDAGTLGSAIGPACHIASNADAFQSIIIQLFRRPFWEEEIELRRGLLQNCYNNIENAKRLIQWIW